MKCLAAALSNSHPVSIHFSAWFFSMIANIANRDPLHLKLADDWKSPDF
jgi:hypothetical protein